MVVVFEKIKFNETQKVVVLEDSKSVDPLQLAKTMREIGDHLVTMMNSQKMY